MKGSHKKFNPLFPITTFSEFERRNKIFVETILEPWLINLENKIMEDKEINTIHPGISISDKETILPIVEMKDGRKVVVSPHFTPEDVKILFGDGIAPPTGITYTERGSKIENDKELSEFQGREKAGPFLEDGAVYPTPNFLKTTQIFCEKNSGPHLFGLPIVETEIEKYHAAGFKDGEAYGKKEGLREGKMKGRIEVMLFIIVANLLSLFFL